MLGSHLEVEIWFVTVWKKGSSLAPQLFEHYFFLFSRVPSWVLSGDLWKERIWGILAAV